MILSIWRYSHFALALSTSVFLVIASVTGVILALEPVTDRIESYPAANLESVSVSTAIEQIRPNFQTLLELEVDSQNQVLVRGVDSSGKQGQFFVNPINGDILGRPEPQAAIYSFTTNLHRSLFLKGIGRFIVGLVSFLLILIGFSGIVLVAKHQGGLRQILSPVVSKNYMRRYHVTLGRIMLFPILIIAATGVYLSAVQFSLLPGSAQMPSYPETISEDMEGPGIKAAFFSETSMSEIRSLQFPFSEFPEDAFEITLKDRSVLVHQYTGQVISSQAYPFSLILTHLSIEYHTGRGSIWWSIILLITSSSLLFFMYSGFKMTLKRCKTRFRIRTFLAADQAEFILLVGSETGKTFRLAQSLASSLVDAGHKVHLGPMNDYSQYPKAKQLLLITSTYGDGDAPSTANRFVKKFEGVRPLKPLRYAVLGLGSLNYPAFCQFAIEVDALLQADEQMTPIQPLVKVNKQDPVAIGQWFEAWSRTTGLSLDWEPPKKPKTALESYLVMERSELTSDNSFMLTLKPLGNLSPRSGDLLAITIPDKPTEEARFYSIGMVDGKIVLSIKKHLHGQCSNYLSQLETGNKIYASLKKQGHFRLPGGETPVLLIANGTGMAPFLGMVHENTQAGRLSLMWGGRNQGAWSLYKDHLNRLQTPLNSKRLIYSREGSMTGYVQDLVAKESGFIVSILKANGIIMICGSMAMLQGLEEQLENISQTQLGMNLDSLKAQGQIRSDCY